MRLQILSSTLCIKVSTIPKDEAGNDDKKNETKGKHSSRRDVSKCIQEWVVAGDE